MKKRKIYNFIVFNNIRVVYFINKGEIGYFTIIKDSK